MSVRPIRISLSITCIYWFFCGIYFWFFSAWSATKTVTVFNPGSSYMVTRVFFVLITSMIIFIISYFFFRIISLKEADLLIHKHALLKSERKAMAGIMGASVAHDIKNILFAAQFLTMELDKKDLSPHQFREVIVDLQHEIQTLIELSNMLIDSGKEWVPGDFTRMDLRKLIVDIIDFIKYHQKIRNTKIIFVSEESLIFVFNPVIVQQMIINLLLNAADAAGENGLIEIAIKKENKTVIIQVDDNGPGVPREKEKEIFEPFYTTKKDASGLGLLTVKAAVAIHNGQLVIGKSDNGGASFVVTLPLFYDNDTIINSK